MVRISVARLRARFAPHLLALVVLVIWFANLDYRGLIKSDEGRYAEVLVPPEPESTSVPPSRSAFTTIPYLEAGSLTHLRRP
jgi:hypothetical protein